MRSFVACKKQEMEPILPAKFSVQNICLSLSDLGVNTPLFNPNE